MSTESYQQLKDKSIELRKEGKTYSEIMAVIPVAKSTISLWLRDVGLAKRQVQRITEARIEGQKKGAKARRAQRINAQQEIYAKAAEDIENVSKRDLWMIGIALYWAEGNKEKTYRPGTGLGFSNSDARMIHVFMRWLTECLHVPKSMLVYEIYIHVSSENSVEEVREYWSREIGIPVSELYRVYFKRFKLKTNRWNIGRLYYGLLRVRVMSSSHILRKIEGWIMAISSRF